MICYKTCAVAFEFSRSYLPALWISMNIWQNCQPDDKYLSGDKNGMAVLDIDFIIRTLNKIFGVNNWKSTFFTKMQIGNENIYCEVSVKNYQGIWITKDYFESLDENAAEIMQNAFSWAAAGHGNIFGKQLKVQFDPRE